MDHSIFNDHNRQQTSFPSHTNFPHIANTRKLTNMNKKSKSGIIQLNLHTSDNHLTLKIIRVKGIQSYLSNILIKITFIPDQKPLECHTRAVPNLHGTGIFNEKFTFEINDDDIHKRLCFSIYDYNHQTNEMNFQGCLSFGIRNTLKKQKIHGWFYILPEDIGEFRHKQVSNSDEKYITKINRDIADLEEHQFTIPRGINDSFGFTVVGDSPTFIGKITENSSAALCGLKSGDFIVKINGQNVSRAQQRTVINLIKHLKHSITLDIHRYPNRELFSFDSSTCSDSSISIPTANRPFVDLAQLGYYIESKPFIRQTSKTLGKPFYEMTNSSMRAIKGSPTNSFFKNYLL